MRIVKQALALFIVGSCAGCASITPPDGGPADKAAPRLVGSTPPNGAVGFAGRTIVLRFDEPVTTAQLSTELRVTPTTEVFGLRTSEKDNLLTLIFPRDFRPQTTYALEFGKGITDITDRTPAEATRLVFSTGDFLDTSQVSGTVTTLLSGKALADATVGLYATAPDSVAAINPTKTPATYLTTTKADGGYQLQNVKAGSYRLFAFVDANKNSRYDEPELLAYQPTLLQVGGADSTVLLKAVRLDTRAPIISSRKEREGSFSLRYSEGVRHMRVSPLGQSTGRWSFRRDGSSGADLTLFGIPAGAAQRFVLTAVDSVGNRHLDTVATRFGDGTAGPNAGQTAISPAVEAGLGAKQWRLVFPGVIGPAAGAIGTLRRQLPIAPDSAGKARLAAFSSEPLTMGKNVSLDSSGTVLLVSLLKPAVKPEPSDKGEVKWSIVLDSTQLALANLTQRPLTGRALPLPTGKAGEEGSGSITVVLQPATTSFALELLRANGSVAERREFWQRPGGPAVKPPPSTTWADLAPGTYRLRVLLDPNANGRWDGPDPAFGRAPEPVIFYPTDIQVRANWEQEVTVRF